MAPSRKIVEEECMDSSKIVWVVGKHGMLARAFAQFFQEKDIKFIATGKDEVDITCSARVEKFLNVNPVGLVINCAAYTHVDGAEKERAKAKCLNSDAPTNLSKILKKRGINFIHFSTDFVFNGFKEGGFTEEDETRAQGEYGKTKLQGDFGVLRENPEALIVRVSWLYGPGENHFVGKILKKLQNGENLTVVDDHQGSLTLASDVVQAVWKIQEQKGIIHFSGRGVSSWYDVARFIASKTYPELIERVKPIKYASLGILTPRPFFSYLNCSKYEKISGEKIASWQDTLSKFLEERPRCVQR
ncbi:hypothetical protein COB21_02500 [Candidatus Aerophobetes bacterium]|uniref:dTDP-4-dehydrorhamnose reductase n=1 Tax=Aerophobetes bacterium TaxID=2030807 RepID=A0A2A4X5G4_UNCAE|nr:MAG: hypothetical protein COB21_02500 [Candidatus Aerophobetes bacterium]